MRKKQKFGKQLSPSERRLIPKETFVGWAQWAWQASHEVVSCRRSDDARQVILRVRVGEEYTPLVRMNSQFWNAGGINIHVGLFSGANISAESAQTLISGGIAFATPPDFQPVATNGVEFILNDKPADDWAKWSPAIPLQAVPEASVKTPSVPNLGSK
jgi:hypothetical protein